MSETLDSLPIKNLESLLQDYLASDHKIQSVEWKHLTDPGENFGSSILALKLIVGENGLSKPLHFVAKLPPKSDYLQDLFNSPFTFYKEIYFYRVIAPELLKFQRNNGIRKDQLIKFEPNFFGGRLGLNDSEKFDNQATIVLENLKKSGYDTVDRIKGMDKEHTIFAIKQIAKMHAIIISYRIKEPEFFKQVILPGLKTIYHEVTMRCVQDMIDKAVNHLKNMEEAQPYMKRVIRTVNEKTVEMKTNIQESWATLIHSDFWINNMLFKHDNSKRIIDMKIVDYQLIQYGNGCRDLIFFLMSSAKPKDINESLDDFIDLYYSTFIDCLKLFDIDTSEFSREKFDNNIIQSARQVFNQCIMMIQVIKATRGSAMSVEDIKSKENFLDLGKSNEHDEILLNIVKTYARRGWFIE